VIAAAPELAEKDPRCKLGVWLFGRSLAHLSFGASFPLCISQAASAQLDVQGDVFDPANRLAVKAGRSQDVRFKAIPHQSFHTWLSEQALEDHAAVSLQPKMAHLNLRKSWFLKVPEMFSETKQLNLIWQNLTTSGLRPLQAHLSGTHLLQVACP